MKKLVITLALVGACVSAFAQGTVNFANVGVGVNAPVYLGSLAGAKLAGTAYLAQLFAGPAGSTEAALLPVGATANFLTGAQSGYFTGGARTIDGVAGGTAAVLQVRAWDAASGATWAAASANPAAFLGRSGLLNITLAVPPATPPNLAGLQSFFIAQVPEPTTMALAGMGAAALLIFRRRR